MSDDDKKSGDYEVGKSKTPTHTRWKKGQSGNPAGRRKKSESLQTKLAKLAGEEIPLHFNGTATRMPRDIAMLHAVMNKAMEGDQRAVQYVTEMIAQNESPVAAPPTLKITPDDINVLCTRADWLGIIEEADAAMQEQHRSNPSDMKEDDDATRF